MKHTSTSKQKEVQLCVCDKGACVCRVCTVHEHVTLSDKPAGAACMTDKFKRKKKDDEVELSKGGREKWNLFNVKIKHGASSSVAETGSRRLFKLSALLSLFFKQLPSTFHFVTSFSFQGFLSTLPSTRSSSPSVWAVCWSPSWPWMRTWWWHRAGSGQAAAAGSSLQNKQKQLRPATS